MIHFMYEVTRYEIDQNISRVQMISKTDYRKVQHLLVTRKYYTLMGCACTAVIHASYFKVMCINMSGGAFRLNPPN